MPANMKTTVIVSPPHNHCRTIVAPLMVRPGAMWSNFWGSIAANGFYARSSDYQDLVTYERT